MTRKRLRKLPAGAKLDVGEDSVGRELNLAHEVARTGFLRGSSGDAEVWAISDSG